MCTGRHQEGTGRLETVTLSNSPVKYGEPQTGSEDLAQGTMGRTYNWHIRALMDESMTSRRNLAILRSGMATSRTQKCDRLST